ncbi:hypothetical protein AB0K93_31660 [Streptomyces sp. NPDC052676]|uniref:hypothetical protein n=1 Tax=Streptomyces sp. NPDC052676 TaxID=3154953 RepID=UPI00341CAC5D
MEDSAAVAGPIWDRRLPVGCRDWRSRHCGRASRRYVPSPRSLPTAEARAFARTGVGPPLARRRPWQLCLSGREIRGSAGGAATGGRRRCHAILSGKGARERLSWSRVVSCISAATRMASRHRRCQVGSLP